MRNPLLILRLLLNVPRVILRSLGDISRQAGANGQMLSDLITEEKAARTAGALTLRDIHQEISTLCDDMTRLMIDQRRINQSLRNDMGEARQAMERLIADGGSAALIPEFGRLEAVLRQEIAHTHHAQARQEERLSALEWQVQQQARLFPSHIWEPEQASRVRAMLDLLRPASARGFGKVRIGRDWDGGYVMLDDFAGLEGALSLGIADDVSWDIGIADRGIRVAQFDPSVDGPPQPHPLFSFRPLRIVAHDQPGGISVDTAVVEHFGQGRGKLLLKIDIEGSEWDVFLAVSAGVMSRFKQIVCEFHTLDLLCDAEFGDRARAVFAKLAETHRVVHVHGNNCGNLANVANVAVPQSLEVTFAARDSYDLTDSMEMFPTPLDLPNQPGRADLYLGPFRFDDRRLAQVELSARAAE